MMKTSPKPVLSCLTLSPALTALTASIAFVALAGVSQAQTQVTPLSTAIKAFNTTSLGDPIGKQQPALTDEEVVAAIRLTDTKDHPLAPDAVFRSLKHIAKSGELPAGAEIEVLTSLDPGGDFVFDTWYVRVSLPKEDGGTYSFPIRSSIVRSHSVAEAAKDLEVRLKQIPAMPGRYRLENRLQELKARVHK